MSLPNNFCYNLHLCTSFTAVIPNLGYVHPREYKPGYLSVREREKMVEKGTNIKTQI
jgi:hypothetical protein